MGLPPLNVPAQLTGRRSGTILRPQNHPIPPGSPNRERNRAMRPKLNSQDGNHGESTPESPTSVLQPNVGTFVALLTAEVVEDVFYDMTSDARAGPSSEGQASAESESSSTRATDRKNEEERRERIKDVRPFFTEDDSTHPRHRLRWVILVAALLGAVGARRLRPGA